MGIENRDDVTATYVLIHGAGADSWCWHRVRPLLEAAGHTAITPDLPVSDDTAGLTEYVDAVRRAVGTREHVTVVAHSFGGFIGPIVAEHLRVDLLVLLHAMIPLPGEAPGQWWSATGREQARRRDDDLHGTAAGEDEFWAHDTPPASPPTPCPATTSRCWATPNASPNGSRPTTGPCATAERATRDGRQHRVAPRLTFPTVHR
ncbi:alpha/beta fold hydrolase [Prescottella soli]|uniref:Alpha/beta fold hydrolase n=1 Tax=Prescottella soli TaxID=1543852 RepID=A0ABW9FZ95_9NOCA